MTLLVKSIFVYSIRCLGVELDFKLNWNIHVIDLAPVVQTLDSAIQWINSYSVDSAIGFPNTYPLDSDLSDG